MGKSITPKYRVEIRTNSAKWGITPMAWNGAQDGRANAANLAKYVAGFNASTVAGGVNGHLDGLKITAATLIRQSDAEVIAEFPAPAPEVDVDAEAESNYLNGLGV